MKLFKGKPAMEMTTSEHLVRALVKFQDELRRAGAGKAPEPEELVVLGELHAKLHELSYQAALDADLQAALTDTAATLAWLLEPREKRVLEVTAGP